MMEDTIQVYVKVNSNNVITQIDSSIFLFDIEGWVKVDEGTGDKYSHAQGLYLDKGLMDMQGRYNYKLVDGKVTELTVDEKLILFPSPTPSPTEAERLASVEKMITMLMGV